MTLGQAVGDPMRLTSEVLITHTLAVVCSTQWCCCAGVMESQVIQHCLRLFTRFPFNNLLHHRVAGLVLTALERGSDDFLAFLFGPCQLIRWLTQAPEIVTPAARNTDSKEGVP